MTSVRLVRTGCRRSDRGRRPPSHLARAHVPRLPQGVHAEQTTDDQLSEITAAGFAVHPRRVTAETVSGSAAAMERRGFSRLVDRMEEGDVLVVPKLVRLGRNAMDVAATVRAHCLALGGVDLTSSTGKLTMGVIDAVAEFERDVLVERTQAGLRRARAEDKRIGCPASLTPEQRAAAARRLGAGESVAAVARALGTSHQTVMRVRDAGAAGASSRPDSAFTARRKAAGS